MVVNPELFAALELRLAESRPDYYASLSQGVDNAALDAFAQRFGLRLPDSFRALYRWRNGADEDLGESLVGNLIFSPLSQIIEAKALLDGMIGSDFDAPAWWRSDWIPFLANGGGDHLCIDLLAIDGGTPGQLRMFYHDDRSRPIRATSIEAWLAALLDHPDFKSSL